MSVGARLRRRLGLDGAGPLFPLAVLFGLNAVDELDQAAFAVLGPNIRRSFGLDLTGVTRLVFVVAVINFVIALGVGYVADRARRTRMATVGASIWGVFSVATGLAPTMFMLGAARVGSGLGQSVNAPTHESLLADYYPPGARAGVYSVHRMANSVGRFAGPLLAGSLAWALGWRAPFVLFAVPTLVFVVLSLRLREPVRGAHERRARGASEELAAIEDEPPSWEESWRILRGVQTLRRVWYAVPFLLGGITSIALLRNLYYDEVFGVSEAGRGGLEAANEPFAMLGLAVGIPLATRFTRTGPERLFVLIAAAASVGSLGFVAFAFAPSLPFAAASSFLSSFALSLVVPGVLTVMSLLVPPRARSFGFVVGRLWALPGLSFLLIAGAVGNEYGMRMGVLVMVPVFLIGGYVLASAGTKVRRDIRSMQSAALASAEFRAARERGEAQLLVCRGVDVHYGHVQVLFGVDFAVGDGELVALLGTNGAGKSTLLKALAGVVDPSSGAVIFDGSDVTFASAQQRLARGLVYMPGGKAVFPTLTVAENLTAASWSRVGDADLAKDVEHVLAMFPRLRERYDQPSGNLSGGEQQMLGLSMAFLARPRLLLIDELSLGLAPATVGMLLDIVREIHAAGTTIVVVEQSVNVALTLAERAVFMEKGEVRFEGRTRDLLDRPDILRSVYLEGASAVGGGNGQRTARSTVTAREPGRRDDAVGRPVLSVAGVGKRFGGIQAVDGVDLELAPGRVLGLIGPNGAGKTTLFDLISGFVPPDAGRVVLDGVDVTHWSPDARARRRMGRSFQDARLFPSMTVREVIAVAHDRHLVSRDLISPALALPDQRIEERLLRRRVDRLIELTGIGAFADKFVGELSTGSRRIVDIACALAHDPMVLLLDEPSSGIAQKETEALAPLLRSIQAATGVALLVIEHDMPLITAVSDELIALDLGRVIARGAPADVIGDPVVVASYLGENDAAIARSGSLA